MFIKAIWTIYAYIIINHKHLDLIVSLSSWL